MKARLILKERTVDGIPCPFPVVKLRVRDKYGTLAELDFRVDTQADFSAIPIPTALREGIPFSQERSTSAIGLVGETTSYRDRVRLVIAGREHDWPCNFVKVPVQRETGRSHPDLLPVLGRAGFLAEYAVGVDSGYLTITRIGPIRRWIRERLHSLWKLFGMVHPTDQPL
jgi:hypothetical protein